MPINATHRFAAFLTNEQNRAYESDDKNAMKAADQQALQAALKASQEAAQKTSKAEIQRATGVPVRRVDLRQAQEERTKSAEKHLNEQGFKLVKTRNCAPNCLLVALLQHAFVEYAERLSSSLSTKVEQLRNALVKESRQRVQSGERKTAIKTEDRLDANDPLIPWLATKLFGDKVRVDFFCADADGNAVNFLSVGKGKQSVKIFDCGGSFKAIVPGNYPLRTQDPEPYV
ncbi:hypothetical protein [Noviherbaspirillum pedocola]|uniref:Uncharacterized protein n=1 Tax=Noviherbaspirillum pedocola TaxID=2801341 RepID=A0A934T2F3_9BURK|nr:hypothetical protein [Noviherbaspirillum pedocola]MBK4738167.1 hypothetical protein [Noviherbaspirillum pedocola]